MRSGRLRLRACSPVPRESRPGQWSVIGGRLAVFAGLLRPRIARPCASPQSTMEDKPGDVVTDTYNFLRISDLHPTWRPRLPARPLRAAGVGGQRQESGVSDEYRPPGGYERADDYVRARVTSPVDAGCRRPDRVILKRG